MSCEWQPPTRERGGKAVLDVEQYLQKNAGGQNPDFVVFLLGINDCFSVDPEDPAAIESRIDEVFEQAEILLSAFRSALPDADFGLCLTPAPNARDTAFSANYGERYTRKGWRRIQYHLVERQLKDFGGRNEEGIFIIPTSLSVDPFTGYPSGNSVHPNREGSQSIGCSVYAWIKNRLITSTDR